MIQEDKNLLLKDLCARLQYGVKVFIINEVNIEKDVVLSLSNIPYIQMINMGYIKECKPYLFPLSSMTEEQKQEFLSVAGYERREEDCGRHTETYYYDMVGHDNTLYPNCDGIDWLNTHHFDYRGLIPKGLAIDATNLNIY